MRLPLSAAALALFLASCIPNTAGAPCLTDANCPTGQRCTAGFCAAGSGSGGGTGGNAGGGSGGAGGGGSGGAGGGGSGGAAGGGSGGAAGGGSGGAAGGGSGGGSGGGAAGSFKVSIVTSGAGMGVVTSTPAGISCPSSCVLLVSGGTTVTLTSAVASGSSFLGWSGGGCAGTGPCTFAANADVVVTASFALDSILKVTNSGNGFGTVTSSPAGILCGSDCSEAYPPSTTVTLTAAASTGSSFTGWSGGCSGTGACVVSMSMSQMVTATFTLNQYLLTVTKAGTGTGTVTGTGISCGIDCTEVLDHGTTVTLTASPNANSSFAGWTGGGCAGTGACVITLTAAATVTATFTVIQHPLTIVPSGTGVGTVTGPGIACGPDCSEIYNSGTLVTLTASVVSGSGSTFSGWSGGGCSGTGNCTVTMSAATTVIAIFTLTGPGGALFFDGTDDLAVLGTSALLDSTTVTVEAWVNLNPSSLGAAVSMWGAGGNPDKYMLQFTNGAPPQIQLRIVRSGIAGQSTLSAAMPINTWTHIALVYDGLNLSLFLNGIQTAQSLLPGNLGPTQGPMKLGVEEIFSVGGTFMNGRMDEVRVWKVARSAAEISASFNKLISPATNGLVAYYRFDEGAGQVLLDSTANGLNGFLGPTNGVESADPTRIFSSAPVGP